MYVIEYCNEWQIRGDIGSKFCFDVLTNFDQL
jgi:hypothetical protein